MFLVPAHAQKSHRTCFSFYFYFQISRHEKYGAVIFAIVRLIVDMIIYAGRVPVEYAHVCKFCRADKGVARTMKDGQRVSAFEWEPGAM
jgi:hypothetical protein